MRTIETDEPALPLPLRLLSEKAWDRAAKSAIRALDLHRDAIDLTDRDRCRRDIDDEILRLQAVQTREAGEAVLALRMLLCDPRRPASFHIVMPALEILLGGAGSPPDLRRRLDVWWECGRGGYALTTVSVFHLAETERKFERDDEPLDPMLDDDEPIAPKPNPLKPTASVVVMARSKLTDEKLPGPWKLMIGRRLPLRLATGIDKARATLRAEYPHALHVVDGLLRDLREGKPARIAPVILVGPAGAGKSRLVRRLGELLAIDVTRYDAAASLDGMFSGSPRTWGSSQPSVPARAVLRHQSANPIVMLDEIEKAGSGTYNGRLWDALVPFLERETAARYPESCLDAELDLSHVSYVATANTVDALPGPLRDRFRILRVPSPTLAHLPALAKHVMSDLARGDEARAHDAPLADDELAVIGKAWARERFSMRKLQRLVAATLEARDAFAPRH